LLIPLSFSASYCFSFFTFADLDGMRTSSVGTVHRDVSPAWTVA
jgi:hypothetical protein